jgi:CheY-like chemotaxis protein
MDIQMPRKDGLQATREIRADKVLEKLPIIALTAMVMPGDYEQCMQAGATAYLSKPVKLKKLLEVVYEYCKPAEAD